ncbi:unnamed protein product [Orchesella dallaii]|uniref:UEV domain-containing protein n=1 Tax=Orchesella dallaii TaxID=48710 RepID=A0ABP1RPE3_9HEXA
MTSGLPKPFDFERLSVLPNLYNNVEVTKEHVLQAIKAYPQLEVIFSPAMFYASWWRKPELELKGTLPVFFGHKNLTCNLIIRIKMSTEYPQAAPVMYVGSGYPNAWKTGQRLKDVGIPNHVYTSGMVHHPYLKEWKDKGHSGHNIKDLLDKLFHAFRTSPQPQLSVPVKAVGLEGPAPSIENHRPFPSKLGGGSASVLPKLSVGTEEPKIPLSSHLKSSNSTHKPHPSASSQLAPSSEGIPRTIRLTQYFTTAQFVDLLLQPETVDWNLERDPVTRKYMLVFLLKPLSSTIANNMKVNEDEMKTKALMEPNQRVRVQEASLLGGKMGSSEKEPSERREHAIVNNIKKGLGAIEVDVQLPSASQSSSLTRTSKTGGNELSKDKGTQESRNYQLRDRKTIARVNKLAVPVPINKSIENAFFREKLGLPPITSARILELIRGQRGSSTSVSVKDLQSRKALALAQEEAEGQRKELLLSPSDLEWLTETEMKRSPYLPQVGDDLIYLREGHKAYVDKVKDIRAHLPLAKGGYSSEFHGGYNKPAQGLRPWAILHEY